MLNQVGLCLKMNKLIAILILAAGMHAVSTKAQGVDFKALIANPTSDMSLLSSEDLEQAAELDGQAYAEAHPGKRFGMENYGIGETRAFKHHLHSDAIGVYRMHFFEALSSFSSND